MEDFEDPRDSSRTGQEVLGTMTAEEPRRIQSGQEILESLKREGWREDIMGVVMKSGDGTLIQVVWPDGNRIEAHSHLK